MEKRCRAHHVRLDPYLGRAATILNLHGVAQLLELWVTSEVCDSGHPGPVAALASLLKMLCDFQRIAVQSMVNVRKTVHSRLDQVKVEDSEVTTVGVVSEALGDCFVAVVFFDKLRRLATETHFVRPMTLKLTAISVTYQSGAAWLRAKHERVMRWRCGRKLSALIASLS